MRRVGLTASGPSAPRGPLVVISCSLSWHVPRGGLSHEDGDWGRALSSAAQLRTDRLPPCPASAEVSTFSRWHLKNLVSVSLNSFVGAHFSRKHRERGY